MGLLDWFLSSVRQSGKDIFTQITTPPPSSPAAARFSPTPASVAPTVIAGQSQVTTPVTITSQQEQRAILKQEGISVGIYRTAESAAATIRRGIPIVSQKLQAIPIIGKPLAVVTPYTSESVTRLIETGSMIPGGVETIGRSVIEGKGAALVPVIAAGVAAIPAGFMKSATEEPAQFTSDILTTSLLIHGALQATKVLPAPRDILFGRSTLKASEVFQAAERGRGLVEERVVKGISPEVPELKLKQTPSQYAGTDIQQMIGGKTTVFTQVSPAGAQPFKTNILTGERSMIVQTMLEGGSPGRIFGREGGFYGAGAEPGKVVSYSPSELLKAMEVGAKPSTGAKLPEVSGVNKVILETVKETGDTVGGSFAQKTLYPEARVFNDIDIVAKNPKFTAETIADKLGRNYKAIPGTEGKYSVINKITGESVSDIATPKLYEKTIFGGVKSISVEGVKVLTPANLLSIKIKTILRAPMKSKLKAARDIEFETKGSVAAQRLMQSTYQPGTPQAYIYYAGLGSEPSFLDLLSGRAKLGMGGRPTISINPKLKVDVFPKKVLEAPITSEELAAVKADLAKLRAGQFLGMKEVGGKSFADIEADILRRGTPEQWAKMRRLTTYAKEHPGSYPGLGALTGIRGEFEILQSAGVKNIITPTTFRGKVGKYIGFGDRPIRVGKDVFELQTFRTEIPEVKPSVTTPSTRSAITRMKEVSQKITGIEKPRVTKEPEWLSYYKRSSITSAQKPIYRVSRLYKESVSKIAKKSVLYPRRIQSSRTQKLISDKSKSFVSQKFVSEISGRISGRSPEKSVTSDVSKLSSYSVSGKSTPTSGRSIDTSFKSSGSSFSPPKYPRSITSTPPPTIITPTSFKSIFRLKDSQKNIRNKYPDKLPKVFVGYGEKAAIATATQILGRK